MPYPLTLPSNSDENSGDNEDSDSNNRSYFMRIAAVNSEVGEGPFSNYIELRKTDKSSKFILFFYLTFN
jgi:hypothetical protein